MDTCSYFRPAASYLRLDASQHLTRCNCSRSSPACASCPGRQARRTRLTGCWPHQGPVSAPVQGLVLSPVPSSCAAQAPGHISHVESQAVLSGKGAPALLSLVYLSRRKKTFSLGTGFQIYYISRLI